MGTRGLIDGIDEIEWIEEDKETRRDGDKGM